MTRVPMIALQALLLVLCGLGIGWALGRSLTVEDAEPFVAANPIAP